MEADTCHRLKNIERDVEKILKLLNGNGQDGVITKLALHEVKVKEIPSPRALKFWSALGGGIVTSTGLVMWLLYMTIKNMFSGTGG